MKSSVVQAYFLKLGAMVCGWLNQAGLSLLRWQQHGAKPPVVPALTVWKRYFSQWIHAASAEDLLKTKIFFDFRCAYGDDGFAEQLRDYLDDMVADNPRFFQLLARNVLPLQPARSGCSENLSSNPWTSTARPLTLKAP